MLRDAELWRVVGKQHGVVARAQLLEFGMTPSAVARRIKNGRLHRVYPGVYAVGRPHLTRFGRWMAAVLACGPGSGLTHTSGAALWELGAFLDPGRLHVSVEADVYRRVPGVVRHAHRSRDHGDRAAARKRDQ
jgi:hypothetical protein